MHDLLDKYLVKKYPKIFVNRYKSPQETCMCWGINVGDGLFYLLDRLCYQIQDYIDNPDWIEGEDGKYHEPPKGTTKCPQVVADQIKEKFSGLRFYYSGGDEYIRGMVDLAESLSYGICETCGAMKNVGRNQRGWITTTCDKHAKNKEDFKINGDKELLEILEKIKNEKENKIT